MIDAHTMAGQSDKAAALLREQMAAARKAWARNSPQLGFVIAENARRLLLNKQWKEADRLVRECLVIRAK